MRLALPWLEIMVAAVSSDVAAELTRAVSKFATGAFSSPITLTASVRCDGAGLPEEARDTRLSANVQFQFLSGIEDRARACYATADGSVATIDHTSGALALHLNRAVFDAPYSTWSDLVAAPLSAAWRHHGYYPLHAAAVSFEDAALMVIGASGSGKTTSALALVEGGGIWRADDKVLLNADDVGIRAASLYANTNLAPETIAAYPSLAFALSRAPINETNAKRPCALAEVSGAVDLSPFRPTALLFPRRATRRRSRLLPLTETEALLRLSAQSPMSGERTAMRQQHQQLVALARQAPAWEIEAGRDALEHRADFVDGILQTLARHRESPVV